MVPQWIRLRLALSLLLGCLLETPIDCWTTLEYNSKSFRLRPSGRQHRRAVGFADTRRHVAAHAVHREDNLLEDDTGHTNRQLAEVIWAWEQKRRTTESLPKVEYSIRKGLQLVDALVEELLQSSVRQNIQQDSNLKSDLIQEGLSALLDAMSQYRVVEEEHADDKDSQQLFEAYARDKVRQRLYQLLQDDTRPIRLPREAIILVRDAKRLLAAQRVSGMEPNLQVVAEELKVPVVDLRDYLLSTRRGTLSMESTVEVDNSVLEDSHPAYRDQDEWELRQGMLLDNGKFVAKDQVVDEYQDEMMAREGDDEAWVKQEQVAGPLQELIPDTEDYDQADDFMLQELIRNDLSAFLSDTLDDTELQVIRLTFGLDQNSLTLSETAVKVGMPLPEIKTITAAAVTKLREAYRRRYLEPYGADDDMDDLLDSV